MVHQIGPELGWHWDAQPGDGELIERHLLRQLGVAKGRVRLDDGRVVVEGADAVGEGGDLPCS